MGISGYSACDVGGVEVLKAYDQAIQIKRNAETTQADATLAGHQAHAAQSLQISFEIARSPAPESAASSISASKATQSPHSRRA